MTAKKLPSLDDLVEDANKLIKTFNESSDLACIIVGAAYLDQLLEVLLGQYLIKGETTQELLKQESGPLGGFINRAKMAYCLGLIPKSLYRNLDKIAGIRNWIAHHQFELDFSDKRVEKMVNELTSPLIKSSETDDFLSIDDFQPPTRRRFIFILVLMVDLLLRIRGSIERRQKEEKGWV